MFELGQKAAHLFLQDGIERECPFTGNDRTEWIAGYNLYCICYDFDTQLQLKL